MGNRIVIGITGASGSIYARTLLDKLATLKDKPERVAVVFSPTAKEVWRHELGGYPNYKKWPFDFFEYDNLFAPPASGSAKFDTMIVCPCSAGTLGRIANGVSETLLTRAADVMLKERRNLILVVREAPYSLIHIENMRRISLAGGLIFPASPSFYSKPSTIESAVATVIDRVLDQAGFDSGGYEWTGEE